MNIDEELYSRQIAAFGKDTMSKLSKLKILIYGMKGLGIETAKNIILAGPEKVSILDKNKVKIEDLCSNFYVNEKDIDKRRDEACIDKLSKLNKYVECEVIKNEKIDEDLIKKYDIIIITEIMDLYELININDLCHKNKKGFIYSLALGLCFYCFIDFGQHIITNLKNTELKKYFIKDIIKGKNTKIIIDESLNSFELNDNDYILFKEIDGCTELLNGSKRKIKNCEENSFEIDEDSTNYEDYMGGGIIEEVRENIFIYNKPIKDMINLPDICESTISKNNYINLHLAFLGLHKFFNLNRKLPDNNPEDLKEIIEITKIFYKENLNTWCNKINLNEEYLKDIFKFSKSEISPICGYGGGVTSQEIIKNTGIFRPINQWFRAEFLGILDKTFNLNYEENSSRYKDQILIFGDETQKNLENLNIFVIGAGAVGCELLKNFAMMGISTGKNSLLTITDHDKIEKSNLNRQFLFKDGDVSKLKSECAMKSIQNMNNKINCKFYSELVTKETEKIFNKEFFEKQKAVIMAVDNFEARNYISKQCEKYNVPYFNCGTEGSYANVEAFIPGITAEASYPTNYKKVIPSCTLKTFPYSINHCVLWSINNFKIFFEENIILINYLNNDIMKFYQIMNKNIELRKQYNKIRKIFKFLKISNNQNCDECLEYCFNKYYKLFIYDIKDLLDSFPPNYINKETGKKFWSGDKRLPTSLEFDIEDEMCFGFIKNFFCLLTSCLNIDLSEIDVDLYIKDYYKSKFKKNKPKKKIFEKKQYYINKIIEIKNEIELYIENDIKGQIHFIPITYVKDSGNKNVNNFIYYSSNLRAKVYNIEQEDKTKINIIAGKIIPQIITSTSSIAGILALQLYVICQNKNYKHFRTGMIDLSDNSLALGIPESKKLK